MTGTMTRCVRKTRLVLIDDDPTIVRLVAKKLREAFPDELEIEWMTDSKEARQWIGQRRCDILISDIEMPGVDGLEMLRLAKEYNAWTRVIFLTGYSTWERIAEAIENGASDYLLKPVDSDELIQVVSHELQRLARWQNAVRGSLRL